SFSLPGMNHELDVKHGLDPFAKLQNTMKIGKARSIPKSTRQARAKLIFDRLISSTGQITEKTGHFSITEAQRQNQKIFAPYSNFPANPSNLSSRPRSSAG
ncbi:MAG: hypothetical protein WBD31_23720, partial [Rubripirellula sp.]